MWYLIFHLETGMRLGITAKKKDGSNVDVGESTLEAPSLANDIASLKVVHGRLDNVDDPEQSRGINQCVCAVQPVPTSFERSGCHPVPSTCPWHSWWWGRSEGWWAPDSRTLSSWPPSRLASHHLPLDRRIEYHSPALSTWSTLHTDEPQREAPGPLELPPWPGSGPEGVGVVSMESCQSL